ncbi:uncharacterized protein LOC111796503 isoform X2 [Cucurbita pepo subsp. pepo]|nr:uncharacterized protein LOC111796503 isoform X2 [Cucurbita pepo subsp. pepo]XP_023534917.1 uncharacterized protein LOC111796503 isoform X2 [Cucurbita pepo subsp. pepo]
MKILKIFIEFFYMGLVVEISTCRDGEALLFSSRTLISFFIPVKFLIYCCGDRKAEPSRARAGFGRDKDRLRISINLSLWAPPPLLDKHRNTPPDFMLPTRHVIAFIIRVRRVDQPSGFSPEDSGYGSMFERLETGDVDRGVEGFEKEAEESNTCSSASTSSSSSIGRNSDQSARSSDDEDSGENDEVQSSYKGPLDMMDSLEEVLPVRKGISKFYNGKSKSFTSLADASTVSSVEEIVKPENAYSKKRRNLMAFNLVWEKNRSFPLKNNGGGISKRPISSSRSSFALAVAMSSSESNSSEDSNCSSYSSSPPPRPPLHPQSKASNSHLASIVPPQRNFSTWRSYSLADLQECATSANKANLTNLN